MTLTIIGSSLGEPPVSRPCILLLTGTSTQSNDAKMLATCLAQTTGYQTAIVERFIGGPFDVRYNPAKERLNDLEKAVAELTSRGVTHIHVVAHSYASYEIIRFLSNGNPGHDAIKSIILADPAGFSGNRRYIRRCMRFLFLFIAPEIASVLISLATGQHREQELRRLRITSNFFIKTIANPVRTLKEVVEIERESLVPQLMILADKGIKIDLVINTDDTMVCWRTSLRFFQRCNIKGRTFGGNHMDLLFNEEVILGIASLLTQQTACHA